MEKRIETMTVKEATKRLREVGLHISEPTLREFLKQRKFEFGECVDAGSTPVSIIFTKLFNKWIDERATE